MSDDVHLMADETILDAKDPYALTKDKIKDPPKGWGPSLRFLGPGMVTSAAVVGSGELLTATTLGAKVGFILLWLVFVSTFVKVGVQIELARWSISTGEPSVAGYNRVPPFIAKRGWISWVGLLNFTQVVIGQGGVLAAAALALSMIVPINGDPFSTLSLSFWVVVIVVGVIAIHLSNRYGIVERIATALVLIVTVATIVMVFGIEFTPFAWSAGDIGSGLTFQVAAGSMGIALGMFGFTGVGGGEITQYTYWCVEKGYAAWTGPNDGSEEWAERARGWIAVMKKDAWVSWAIYTVSTAAFYILGASVLHPQGLEPSGNEVLEVISKMFTDTVGEWSKVVFLLLAALALIKTLLANVPGFSRQVSNTLAVFGVFDWKNVHSRNVWMRGLIVGLPIIWGAFAIALKAPLTMVLTAGILNSVFLMTIVIAVVYLSRKETDPRVRDGKVFTTYLYVSGIAVFMVGVLSLIDAL
ncbi:Nramp family divalent metal transporter [Brooklawnia cerclae]|uniref:Mn2+/Fe2+ NRAMP family transporter n=1 Tax=Brooklawnia cerclae TaxID=349934 RepID=A0ABX0SNF7_9ACTN|nr:Mn2+/Fe2+ NRAMP family transporter [Brooklawnia cerclae]